MSRRPARDDLRRDLAALAGTAVPELAPEPIETTEARLRAVHATLTGPAPQPAAPRGSRRRAVVGSLAVAAGALAALLAVFLFVDREPNDRTSLVLTAAEHAFIELPDGRRIEAEVGRIEVPNGSRLVVEAGGTLTVDGITLEPGEIATVDDGTIDVDRDGATPGSDPTDPGGDGTGDSVGPGGTGDTGPGGGGDPSTTTRTAGDTTTTAAPTVTTRPANTTVAPTTSTDSTGPTTTTARHDVAPLRAGAEIVDSEVVIRWARYEGADFRGYLVIATTDGTTPRPGSVNVTVLVARRDRDLTRAAAPYEAAMKIRVLVIGPERVVLAASRVLEPGA